MKFTLSWLKQFLNTTASAEEIADKLTQIGLELESLDNKSLALENFEVASIIEAVQHPNADKLRICKVLTAKGELQIVCGAPNARAGIKVVLANIGVEIPKGKFKIKQSSIRGIESCGMLCSAEELMIGQESDGIIELPIDAVVGDKVAAYLGLDDVVFHINVTPNRADCLGVYGIARDLAAAGMGTLKPLSYNKPQPNFNSIYEVKVDNNEICPIFALREIRNIKNTESPSWLKHMLQNIGVGSISAIVDVTNYIAYSFAQPMHAYDAHKIKSGLEIKLNVSREADFLALNGKEYKLSEGDIVISDAENIQCLAGIIGSEKSACTRNSNSILLEAAVFNAEYINRSGKKHAIDTDAKHRFERYVDGSFTKEAIDFATSMILEICGGQASEVILHDARCDSSQEPISLDYGYFQRKIGFDLEIDVQSKILAALGFNNIKDATKQALIVTVPSWRYDISFKEDLVEEIIRIYGYDKIQEQILPRSDNAQIGVLDRNYTRLSDIKRLLAQNGYQEVVSWSFMNSKLAEYFTILQENLHIDNPISSDLDYMRPSIMPNLLEIAQKNLNRSLQDFCLFELGPIFRDNTQTNINHAAAIRVGYDYMKDTHGTRRAYDVFDIKTDFACVLNYCGLDINKCQISQDKVPSYYHPTRSASIYLGKNLLGYFGEIHPKILQKYKIDKPVIAFELEISSLPFSKNKSSKRPEFVISNYQPVTRDYAFLLDDRHPAGQIINAIASADKHRIQNVELFDCYKGVNVPEGQKSLAISVTIQDSSKTLDEADLNYISSKILSIMSEKFGAKIRDS